MNFGDMLVAIWKYCMEHRNLRCAYGLLAAAYWHPMQQPAKIVPAIPFKQTCRAFHHASSAGAGKCVAIVVVTEKCV